VLRAPGDLLKFDFVDDNREDEEGVPDSAMSHPMFNVKGGGDGPTQEELEEIRAKKGNMVFIKQTDLQSPNWQEENMISGANEMLARHAKVPDEMSSFESKRWAQTTHAAPSKQQKRKHQINWLAGEAIDKESELADRNASGKLSKAQTSFKYGW